MLADSGLFYKVSIACLAHFPKTDAQTRAGKSIMIDQSEMLNLNENMVQRCS
jgi:hypothetical protein